MRPDDWYERSVLYTLSLYGYRFLSDHERTLIIKRIDKAAKEETDRAFKDLQKNKKKVFMVIDDPLGGK